jgi:hypothetical protein
LIGQGFDNAAVGDLPAGTLIHHARQFVFECGEAGNPLLYFDQACTGNRVGSRARLARIVLKRQQSADCIDLEPKLTSMPDEGKPAQVSGIVKPPLVRGACRRR